MASSACHLSILAIVVAVLAVAAPRASASSVGRFFFSKTARPQADAVEPEKAAADANTDAADPNSATVFSRPSTGGSGRGYGLYGRPEENFPPDYFRSGVHRNKEKLMTPNMPTTSAVDEADEPLAQDNGSGRGRPPWTNTNVAAEEEQRNYGMSDTRLYQNGRNSYDVDTGRYGYGRESNPARTRTGEFGGAGDRRGRYYGDAAGYYRYGNELGNGVTGNQDAFQVEGQNGRYIP